MIEFIPSAKPPARLPITAVKLIYKNRSSEILLIEAPKGWDIPVGHVEQNESLQGALSREISEETGGIVLRNTCIGYLKITNQVSNEASKLYPKQSAVAFYIGDISSVKEGERLHHEATQARFFPMDNLPKNVADWSPLSYAILQYADSTKP